MKIRFTSLFALLLAGAAPAIMAQSSSPIVSITVTSIANTVGGNFSGSNVNGGFGDYTSPITIGTTEAGAAPFTVAYFINGVNIGVSNTYAFPSPGTYYISASVTDANGHAATSVAVQYYATGIQVVSPLNNTILPAGSSVVIQAAAGIAYGSPAQVEFFIGGASEPFAISYNYPYQVIFTPPPIPGSAAFVYAVAYNPPASPINTPLASLPGPAASNVAVISAPDTGILVQQQAEAPPTCTITTPIGSPTGTSPGPTEIPIPNYGQSSSASRSILVTATPGTSTAFITKVELYINGVLFGTDTAYPYSFAWQPSVTGTYNLTALTYDDKGNVVASTTGPAGQLTPQPTTVVITPLPAVAITSPGNGGILNGGGSATITASATDAVGILSVQFFQDGTFVGVATQPTTPGGSNYSVSFKPVQNINPTTGIVEPSVLEAIATDTLGATQNSPEVTVTVTAGGSGGTTVIGTPPTVSITTPINLASVVVNTPITLQASATAPNGNVAQVSFLVDNKVLTTATQYPYQVVWTPENLGTYQLVAEVTDNVGDVSNSPVVNIKVVAEPPPAVSISSPSSGGIVTVGTAVTVNADASSQSGTVKEVDFYENNVLIGTSTTSPFSVTWTPQTIGIYTLTAVATDNALQQTTSASVVVEAEPVNTGVGTATYFGNYQGLTESGYFAFVTPDGVNGTYIGISNTPSKSPVTYITNLTVSSQGAFSSTAISGVASTTGVNGTLMPSQDIFIGGVPVTTSISIPSGYFTGNLAGQSNSQFAVIVGTDGEIMVYVTDGSFVDAGYGSFGTVASNGAFSVATVGGNTVSGTISPATGFLTANLAGGPGGAIIAARVSAGTFSDGVLRNISTRGEVGTGSNVMIAGFVVGGTSPKNLLVRASGPALAALGVQGAISGTSLNVYLGSALVASNTGWSSTTTNASAVSAAGTLVSAFPFASGSADSALVGTFPPGAYTANVAGSGGATGISLVEVYDLDSFTPFTSNKLTNVSTRGYVGTGSEVLIGGFYINGSAPKRVLIRAAGPGLAAMGVSGVLATPHLQLINSAQTIVRENYSWQNGNDPGMVSAAEAATGAFPFVKGSSDSAILIVLPPGLYSAVVSGANSSTGVALIEVYEIN